MRNLLFARYLVGGFYVLINKFTCNVKVIFILKK